LVHENICTPSVFGGYETVAGLRPLRHNFSIHLVRFLSLRAETDTPAQQRRDCAGAGLRRASAKRAAPCGRFQSSHGIHPLPLRALAHTIAFSNKSSLMRRKWAYAPWPRLPGVTSPFTMSRSSCMALTLAAARSAPREPSCGLTRPASALYSRTCPYHAASSRPASRPKPRNPQRAKGGCTRSSTTGFG
jgi:hypothetical protein